MDAFDRAREKFREWERWAETVKPGDRVRAGGMAGTVTAVTNEYLWARIDGQTDALPWDWGQVEPAPVVHPDGGTAEKALRELRKAVDGPDLLTAARQAVARIDKDGDIIYCLKQRLSQYEEVD